MVEADTAVWLAGDPSQPAMQAVREALLQARIAPPCIKMLLSSKPNLVAASIRLLGSLATDKSFSGPLMNLGVFRSGPLVACSIWLCPGATMPCRPPAPMADKHIWRLLRMRPPSQCMVH